jgi:hypothetical protein
MRRGPLSVIFAIVLAAGFVYGTLRLFGIQFAVGDVYPEYSSLRSDPKGTKLLFESLAALQNVKAERNYLPLEYLPERSASVVLLGTAPASLDGMIKPLERVAGRGNRIVIALHQPAADKSPKGKELGLSWGIRLAVDEEKGRARRLYFAETKDWKIVDRVGAKVIAVEKPFGNGTVALFADSEDFTNESTVAMDRLRQVSAAFGPYNRIVFDEQHLGIAEGGSVVDLARRFRLTGFALGLGLLAALMLWRNGSGFPPPREAGVDGRLAGRTSQAGLLTLLRRHIVPRDLADACWREWLAGNRGQVPAARLERAEAIVRARGAQPLDTVREIHAVLHSKGEL